LRKKQAFQGQSDVSDNLLERLLKYQDNLKAYREEYNNFISQMKKIIDKIFDDYSQKIENLIKSLFSFNQSIHSSIRRFDDIYRNNENNFYNNIKKLINELLSLERMKLNYNHNDTEKFLNTSISLKSSINMYHLPYYSLRIPNINQSGNKSFNGYHFRIGNYELKYNFSSRDMSWNCRLIFTYECKIPITELRNGINYKFNTNVQIFSTS